MLRNLLTFFVSVLFLIAGLISGVIFAPQLRMQPPFSAMISLFSKMPGLNQSPKLDENSPFELYDYPTIKWKPKAMNEKPGAIAQLWTRYEAAEPGKGGGKMNYRLTIFKDPDKSQCEVQLLDNMGFKLTQFIASDFHEIPGAAEIMEARDSHDLTEDLYRKVRDYSVK